MDTVSISRRSHNFKDITGQRYGRLLVVSPVKRPNIKAFYWECQCDCGSIKVIYGANLRRGLSQSCGCLHREKVTLHGMSNSPERNSWEKMISRCYDSSHNSYKNYGARGISVCERWRNSFIDFLADVGRKPTPEHSLDRKKNDGNYEPDNVRWATRLEQNRNMRKTRFIEYGGIRKSLSEWSEDLNMKKSTIRQRLNSGWTEEQALTLPVERGRSLFHRI